MNPHELRDLMEDLDIEHLSSNMQQTWIRGCCPFHNETRPSFGISTDKLFFNCFGCHATGSLLLLVARLKMCTPQQARKYIETFGEYDPESSSGLNWSYLFRLKKHVEKTSLAIVSPSMFSAYKTRERQKKARVYLESRGVVYRNNGTLYTRLRVGYDPKQKRVMFPWNDVNGNFFGCTGRLTYKDKKLARYMPYFGLQKGHRLFFGDRFNLSKIKGYVIVEGEIDTILVSQLYRETGYLGLGLAKSHATGEQLNLLKEIGGPYLIGLDQDDAGIYGAEKLNESLSEAVPCSILQWPKKDAGACSYKERLRAVKSVNSFFDLRKFI